MIDASAGGANASIATARSTTMAAANGLLKIMNGNLSAKATQLYHRDRPPETSAEHES
jgi:hypothetical protein